jgi:hypothetical protein
MKKILVAVRDSKLEAFMNPFVVDTVPLALRIFGDAVNNGKTPISDHPEDFDLYRIAEVDLSTGLVFPCSPIVHLGSAKDLVCHE